VGRGGTSAGTVLIQSMATRDHQVPGVRGEVGAGGTGAGADQGAGLTGGIDTRWGAVEVNTGILLMEFCKCLMNSGLDQENFV